MAHAALAGFNPKWFIDSESEVEMALLRRVADRAIELNSRYRQDIANRTISLLAKVFTGNKSKKR